MLLSTLVLLALFGALAALALWRMRSNPRRFGVPNDLRRADDAESQPYSAEAAGDAISEQWGQSRPLP